MLKAFFATIFIFFAFRIYATEEELREFVASYHHSEESTWVQSGRTGCLQGIKMHIFAPLDCDIYHRLLLIVLPVLKEKSFVHKIHSSFNVYQNIAREDILYGKAITIYPKPYEIVELLRLLASLLNNFDWGETEHEGVAGDIKVQGIRNLSWRYGRFFGPKKPSLYIADSEGYLGYLTKEKIFKRFGEKDFLAFYFSPGSKTEIPTELPLYNLTLASLYRIYRGLKLPDILATMEGVENALRNNSMRIGVIDDDRTKRGGQEGCFAAEETMGKALAAFKESIESESKRVKLVPISEEFVEQQVLAANALIYRLTNEHDAQNSKATRVNTLPSCYIKKLDLEFDLATSDEETIPLLEDALSAPF